VHRQGKRGRGGVQIFRGKWGKYLKLGKYQLKAYREHIFLFKNSIGDKTATP